MTILFLHGLNTYGDDDIHIGPVRFGPMHGELQIALRKLDLNLVPALGLGMNSPEVQAERVHESLDTLGIHGDFHILAQSTGGLTARALAYREGLRERVRSIITIGTPHGGTLSAQFGIEFPDRHPGLSAVFASFGYDTRVKAEIFRHFTPEAMVAFNRRFPPGPRVFSLLCEVPRADLSWPLQFFYSRLHPLRQPSDGFIWIESQKLGQELGPFALDHFGELGFFPHLTGAARRSGQAEFRRMVETVASIVSK